MASNLENSERKKVVDFQKKKDEREMFRRIRKSIEKEKEPDIGEILKAAKEEDVKYLRLVK